MRLIFPVALALLRRQPAVGEETKYMPSVPQQSPAEYQAENDPTYPPELPTGMHHGCVWQPGFYQCECPEIISACGTASAMCDKKLEELTSHVGQLSEYNLRLNIDHPLLNTMQVQKAPFLTPHGGEDTPIPFAGNVPPEQFDWRLFNEAPPPEATMSGICTPSDVDHYMKCLMYFQSCYASVDSLEGWQTRVVSSVAWAEKHPSVRPGLPE